MMLLKNYLNVNFFLIFSFIIFLVVAEENKKNVNYESNREYVHISQRNKNVTVSEDQNMCC
jgi:large-conductance mechanosensitive channel